MADDKNVRSWELETATALGKITDQLRVLPEIREELVEIKSNISNIQKEHAVFRSNCAHSRQSFRKDILQLHELNRKRKDEADKLSFLVKEGAKQQFAVKTAWKTLTVIAGVAVTVIGLLFASLELYSKYSKTGGTNEQPSNTTRNVDKAR